MSGYNRLQGGDDPYQTHLLAAQDPQYPPPYPSAPPVPSSSYSLPPSALPYQPAPYPVPHSSFPYPSFVNLPAPGAVLHPGTPGHLRPGLWSDSILDCFDSGVICLLSLFLPPLRFALTLSRLSVLSFAAALLLHLVPYALYTVLYVYLNVTYPSTYGTDVNPVYTVTYSVLLCVMIVAHIAVVVIGGWGRGRVRKAYGINGSVVEDVCWHCWCGCCAIAQEARHVDRDYGIQV